MWQCLRCNRGSPRSTSYLMGQSPPARVNVQGLFFSTGVDYAGLFYVKDRVRSETTIKAHFCLFVCLTTKAVHLELATGFTTEAFIKCLQRLTAWKSMCREIYPDNGINFVVAWNEMQKTRAFFQSNHKAIFNYAVTEGFDWHFIPPHAPPPPTHTHTSEDYGSDPSDLRNSICYESSEKLV